MKIKYTLQDYDTLRFRLDFYTHDIIATQFDKTAMSFRVDAQALMAAFSNFHVYLPPNVCFAGKHDSQGFLGLFIPPAFYSLAVSYGEENLSFFRIPMPPMWLYLSWEATRLGHARLFALKSSTWPTPADRLYAAPMPNVDPTFGSICLGNIEIGPRVFPDDAHAIFQFLMAAPFSNHQLKNKSRQYPDNVLLQWHELSTHSTPEYPLDDLVETGYPISHFLESVDRRPAPIAAHRAGPEHGAAARHEEEVPVPGGEMPND